MKTSNLSILMAALLATSGFALAQQPNPAKAGTDGGSGPTANEKAAPGAMPATRAEVKSGINVDATKSGTDGGSGASPGAPMKSSAMASTSAERKAKRAERKAKRTMKKRDMAADGQMKPKAP